MTERNGDWAAETAETAQVKEAWGLKTPSYLPYGGVIGHANNLAGDGFGIAGESGKQSQQQ